VRPLSHISLQNIGVILRKTRNEKGIRDVAREISISPATLSRIENGKLPDIETFSKICRWLKADPGEVLGVPSTKTKAASTQSHTTFHLKADKNLKPETAKALADMIISAQDIFNE
jgi:transcriptional regulator with XRE-family HTH domain